MALFVVTGNPAPTQSNRSSRKLRLAVAAGAAAALLVPIGSTALGAQPSPNKDRLSGDGVRQGNVVFSIDATSAADGSSPTGKASFTFSDGITIAGPVTCLHVTGNAATIVGLITSRSGPSDPDLVVGNPYIFAAQDNGVAQKGGVSPDRASFVAAGAKLFDTVTAAQACNDATLVLGSPLFVKSVLSGNFNVNDAS